MYGKLAFGPIARSVLCYIGDFVITSLEQLPRFLILKYIYIYLVFIFYMSIHDSNVE